VFTNNLNINWLLRLAFFVHIEQNKFHLKLKYFNAFAFIQVIVSVFT